MSAMKCDGVWAPKELSAFTATTTGIITLLATTGNLLVVLIVIKDPLKKLHTPFNYFLVNLAISDLIVGAVNEPIAVYTHTLEYFRQLDNPTAKAFHITFFISVTASILSLIALSVDRYVAITYPLKYRIYLSWLRCGLISVGIWLFALSLPMVYFKIGYIDYLMVYANSAIFVASVILIFTYVRIYKFLRNNTHTMKQQLRTSSTAAQEFMLKRLIMEKKVTRVFLIVLVIFFATYLPPTIMIYILQYCPTCDCVLRHWLRDLSFLLIALNSCMNPFVYTMRLKPFRQSLRHMFRHCYQKRKPHSDSTVTIIARNQYVGSTSSSTDF